jgi:hypothetical protein
MNCRYRSARFRDALYFENGHATTYYQIHDSRNTTSYVKEINRVGNDIFVVPWTGKSSGQPSGEQADTTTSNLVCAIRMTHQDLMDIEAHGKVLSSQERIAQTHEKTPAPTAPDPSRHLSVAFTKEA